MAHPLRAAGREIRAIARAETETHRHLRDRIAGVAAVSVIVNLVCAVLAYLLERHAAGSDITSIGSALFFSSTQLLTVSSSMTNPLTTAGRVLGGGMEGHHVTGL